MYDEELLIKSITEKVIQLLVEYNRVSVPVGISNRHIHISEPDLKQLFGDNYKLTKFKDLEQPGQFASNELVTLKGPRGLLERVRILGPVRAETQIELSLSDGFKLGVETPIRESGKIDTTPGIELIGPHGSVVKTKGVIAALRHIHMPKTLADQHNFKDKQFVDVEVNGLRKATLGQVLLRVSDQYKLEMHLDMDEANAVCLKNGACVTIL